MAAIKSLTVVAELVHPDPPGVMPLGHHIGSLVAMMSAAACVASDSTVPVLLITTTGVAVATGEFVSLVVSADAGVSVTTAVTASWAAVVVSVACAGADVSTVGT